MAHTVKLSHVGDELENLSYPITRNTAATELSDVTVTFADGQANLGEIVSDTGSDSFGSSDELESELYNVLPIEAVGEPGQSEGDA